MKQAFLKRQTGMTLLEVTASLAIGTIIIMGALALFGGGSAAANSNAFIQNITSLRSAVKSLYLGQGSYDVASINGTLINSSKVPADWTGSGTTITNNFGGAVVITGATSTFNLTTGAIPKDVCIGALPSAAKGWSFVGVGADAAAALAAATITPASMTPAQATTSCSATTQFIAFIGS